MCLEIHDPLLDKHTVGQTDSEIEILYLVDEIVKPDFCISEVNGFTVLVKIIFCIVSLSLLVNLREH